MITDTGLFLLTSLGAGLLGGAMMEGTLWLIGAGGWAKADMIVALGGLLTKSRVNARRVGVLVHAVAAMVFALAYAAVMVRLGYTQMPEAMLLGAGIGFAHGLIVSLGLVWVVAERHPLEEFNEAGLAIGLSHLVGHVAYGAVVGFVVGLSPL